jgi:threonine dehydratase
MLASRVVGKVSAVDSAETMADGIAVKRPGELTFAYCEKYADEIVTVTDDEISSAILALMENNPTVAEGAGAAGVAAAMFDKFELSGKNTVCVVSGGNIDVNILSRVITRGLSRTGRVTSFSVRLADKPRQLARLLEIIGDSGANIISVEHDRQTPASGVDGVIVRCSLETRDAEHGEETLRAVKNAGFPPL